MWTLPLGIVAFSAQLTAQLSAGAAVDSLGKYVAVVLGGNVLQFFVVLPLFLLIRKINPFKVFKSMLPAVLMALVPSVLNSAEEYAGVVIPMWSGNIRFQTIVILACVCITVLLCRQVFAEAVAEVAQRPQ